MAFEYLAWDLLFGDERVNILERRLERRLLRDAQNPFELPQQEFMCNFRLTQQMAMELADELRPHLEQERVHGLSTEIQVLVAVQFFACGSYQRPTGNQYNLNVSQPVVSRCIRKVTLLINQLLLRRWVKFPMTPASRELARNRFRDAPQPFEGAIGAIDCTFVHILAPKEHEEAYVNHHGNHSLNVQAIVDPDMRIININARYPGARNDSYIWSVSPIRAAMEYHYNNGERRTWLIGDSGYPLEPWLMTPMPNYPEGSPQYLYTRYHCKARNVVERFFGNLKSMWRCLSYQRVLMYNPDIAGCIVNACAVLHNMYISHGLPVDVAAPVEEVGVPNDINNEIEDRGGPRAVGERIRMQIIREKFPNHNLV